VEKYGSAEGSADDSIIRRMRIIRWINKVTDTHSEYVILLLLHGDNRQVHAPQYYVILVWPVLLNDIQYK